jgi:hypothetical protein
MTGAEPAGEQARPNALDFVPELRNDFVRRTVSDECLVWSPVCAEPVVLDAVARVMLDVIDGTASIAELAVDVRDVLNLPLEIAQRQVTRVVEVLAGAGLLTSHGGEISAEEAIAARELFVGGTTPCSENASRLGTVSLHVKFGGRMMRVSCDSRRAARTLRSALAEHLVDGDDDVPVGFIFTAPQGLKRSHLLMDRSGFALSDGRGLNPGLHALASHLTALLGPAPGTVRIRARVLVSGGRTIVCLFPLLYHSPIDERDVARAGLHLVDRLAIDVDDATGRVTNPEIPWPALASLGAAPRHVGTGGTRTVTAVLNAAPPPGWPPPTAARTVAALAANGVDGSPADLLDAAIRLVRHSEVRTVEPDAETLVIALRELATADG